MDTKIVNPHDRFFKAVLSKEEHAREFLQLYLPRNISQLIDFDTLFVVKDTFIEKELTQVCQNLM